eukprot:TRINITY_DN74994_c0_g1_i1.p1 TRINITY_DN74994_c0_g1~~TRINITY_DN74994_c0_g1_i1.p1  ORF type:complete len:529 (+),score=68.26 TRINITY_DN74994_c0_g1_i1:146-1732(+)
MTCQAVALHLLPPPSLEAFSNCYRSKLLDEGVHNWSTPGAEVAAQADCWCANNLTGTIGDYGCCDHPDFFPMCTLDCSPDCDSELAKDCIQECPMLCLEAGEYVVQDARCQTCDWVKCWPMLNCMANHTELLVATGQVRETCDEIAFETDQRPVDYWECWRDAPKHSSHWNIASSILHCGCREDMKGLANETACCGSRLYDGVICDATCVSERDCSSQEAQTCVHGCQSKCKAFDWFPSEECRRDCLLETAACYKYLTCRPPATTGYVCDDGRWPASASGCCHSESAPDQLGCPTMCEEQRLWRVDKPRGGNPWWARFPRDGKMVPQCTCGGCPATVEDLQLKMGQTIEEHLWENGQMILIDIARREGLLLGPNRQMQEMMAGRNDEISRVVERKGSYAEAREEMRAINARYAVRIRDAARLYGDTGDRDSVFRRRRSELHRGGDNYVPYVLLAIIVNLALAIACIVYMYFSFKQRPAQTPLTSFPSSDVVIGSPVQDQGVAEGQVSGTVMLAPVTVAAPTKGKVCQE